MNMIQQRINECETLLARIKNHPMCLRVEVNKRHIMVTYPDMAFRFDGARCGLEIGKAAAFRKILETIERHWVESYPFPNGTLFKKPSKPPL